MKREKGVGIVILLISLTFCHLTNAQTKTGNFEKEIPDSQTSTLDSLKKMLAFFRTKIADSSLKKSMSQAQELIEKGRVDDSLATKLLEVQDVLFSTQWVNKKTLLQYTSSLVHLLRQASQISRRILAVGLNSLANVYTTMGAYQQTASLYEEALAIIKNTSGEENIDYADILVMFGLLCADQSLYDKALSLYQQAEDIYAKIGEDGYKYATLLNSKALLYVTLGFHEKALPLYDKALAILSKTSSEETPDYAGILNNKANVYENLGLYKEAIPLYEIIISIDKKIFTEDNPDCAASIYNFGYLYESMGLYDKALPKYQHALSIIEKDLGKNNGMYATILDNLAGLYQRLGQYSTSENLGKKALAIKEKVLGKKHFDYAKSLNNLAALYNSMGKYQEALRLLKQALQINKEKFGVKHYGYATGLNSLGNVYSKMGLYKKAFPLFDSALKIRKEILGEEHPDYANSLNSMAGYYKETGKYSSALALYQQALVLRKKVLGEFHPEYANSLNNAGLLYSFNNDTRTAGALLSQSHTIQLQNISENFTSLSEDEKLKLIFMETPKLYFLPSLVYSAKMNDAQVLTQLYNSELILKGMVLQDQQNVLSSIRKSNDTISLQQYGQWKLLGKLLSRQLLLPVNKRRSDLDSLQNVVSELGQNLSRTSAAFRNQQVAQSITVNAVTQKLLKGEAAIEFIRFKVYNKKWKDSILYGAMVVLPQDTITRFVPLFEEKKLLQLLKTSTGANTDIFTLYPSDEIAAITSSFGSSLYKLIWKPLEKDLQGVHTIYYAPAGLLHRIAFPALRKDEKHLLIDIFQLNQLLSTRSVALPNQPFTKLTKATVWGDIQYNLKGQNITSQNQSGVNRGPDISFNLYTNDVRGSIRKSAWAPLPGTKKEIGSIRKIFEDAGLNISTASGTMATEGAFKAFDGKSPQVIHLATHGFFLPVDGTNETYPDKNAFTVQKNPMFRSGLVLAGGNRAWLGKPPLPGKEDGILTADEISQMNLSNTELVVLSACETALGDLMGNEGVIGLQRAFKIAGVKQMIVSLWRIPDKETTELMTLFYKNWLSGRSTKEALQEAQRSMRKKYPPYYWAGFVLVE